MTSQRQTMDRVWASVVVLLISFVLISSAKYIPEPNSKANETTMDLTAYSTVSCSTTCRNGGELKVMKDLSCSCSCRSPYYGNLCQSSCTSPFYLLSYGSNPVGCYLAIFAKSTWYNAPAHCAAYDPRARLAQLDTQHKNEAVKMHLLGLASYTLEICSKNGNDPNSVSYWTAGARRVHQDCTSPFYWKPTGGPQIPVSYSDWEAGQPDCLNTPGYEARESCLTLVRGHSYRWNDLACDWPMCSVCEIPYI